MENETVVVVINNGSVQDVYSDNTNLIVEIIDLDLKKMGEEYEYEFTWPDTQLNEDKVQEIVN